MKVKELIALVDQGLNESSGDTITLKATDPNGSYKNIDALRDLLNDYDHPDYKARQKVLNALKLRTFINDGAISIGGKKVIRPGSSVELSLTNLTTNANAIKALETTVEEYEDILLIKDADEEYAQAIKDGKTKEEATAIRNKFLDIK